MSGARPETPDVMSFTEVQLHMVLHVLQSSPLLSSVVGRKVFSRWLGAFGRFAFGSRWKRPLRDFCCLHGERSSRASNGNFRFSSSPAS